MKVQSNHHNRPPTPAELEALRQFEASQRNGEVLFHPQVASGQPVPNYVAFFEETGRFAVTILEGHYAVEDGRWFRHQDDDAQVPADNPLEACCSRPSRSRPSQVSRCTPAAVATACSMRCTDWPSKP